MASVRVYPRFFPVLKDKAVETEIRKALLDLAGQCDRGLSELGGRLDSLEARVRALEP